MSRFRWLCIACPHAHSSRALEVKQGSLPEPMTADLADTNNDLLRTTPNGQPHEQPHAQIGGLGAVALALSSHFP